MEGATRKRAYLREEDVLLLFNKYSITTILNLLKEVAHHASSPKLDWDALVKDTCTGISSAREYQMLWRHIAYQTPLQEKLETGAEPLDDDSDVEFELDTFPSVTSEALAEAASSVKILISSGSVHEHGPNRSTTEAPFSTNMSNGQAPSVGRQLAGSSVEAMDGNGGGAGGPAKKKRKLWTKEEDMELIAAVDKCGEGNWANILKGDFKHDRTASQLSQRWSIIRKKRANLSMGSGSNPPGSASTEAHMAATWQAVNMAIKMPITGSLATRRPGTGAPQSTDPPSSSATPSTAPVSEPIAAVPPTDVPQSQPPQPLTSQKVNPLTKPRVNPKVPAVPGKLAGVPTSIIQAAAIAAGGRIAPPSTAASHFKAAQSKNAVHIRPGGAILPGSKATGSTPPLISASQGSKSMGAKPLTQFGTPGLSGQPYDDGLSLVEDPGNSMDVDSDEKMKVDDGTDLVPVKRENEAEIDGLGDCSRVDFSEKGKSSVETLKTERDGSKVADTEKGKSTVPVLGTKGNETIKSTTEDNGEVVVDCGDRTTAADLEREKSNMPYLSAREIEPEKSKMRHSNSVEDVDMSTPDDPENSKTQNFEQSRE